MELIFENDIPVSIILEYLNDFKVSKPSGCSKISSKLYLTAFKVLGELLAFIFNLSIKTYKVPTAWKKGTITPIPKKGDKRQINNVRPKTLTHICSKLLTKIIAARYIVASKWDFRRTGLLQALSPSWLLNQLGNELQLLYIMPIR